MQLRTTLISTGILALATSLTLGGPIHVILLDLAVEEYYTPPQALSQGDTISVTGFQPLPSGPSSITGYIYMSCSAPGDSVAEWVDPSNNVAYGNKAPIDHITVGTLTAGTQWDYTIPNIIAFGDSSDGPEGTCSFEVDDEGGVYIGISANFLVNLQVVD
ncbi:hypothetical protein BC827DRAFT_1270782 [Russula dissimulans]|nr:hypothetical protein BC827DRAFT_1273917 [Russula dissimulans]KAH9956746.1 hypothetical protein BC827DRAFT_1270782 [Russula dissimulans]